MKTFIRRFFILVVGLAVAAVAFVFFASTSERSVPEVVVGFTETTLDVAHRDTPLPVFIWYPTDSDTVPELIGQNALFYGFHARRDAAGTDQAAPVVVLSHGSGGNAVALGWIATTLAQRGMIVIATNHPGTTSRDSTPEATVRIWERPMDLSALVDFADAGLPFGITADTDRVAAMGFSLGGYSALSLAGLTASKAQFIEYCDTWPDEIDCGWMNAGGLDFQAIDQENYERSNEDKRIQAVVGIDPALPLAVTQEGLADLTVDALIVQLGEDDTIFEGMLWADNADAAQSMTRVVVPDTYHFAFIAECSLMGKVIISTAGDDNICADQGTRARADVHAELRPLIANFLAEKLDLP